MTIKEFLSNFRNDETGVASVELILAIPLLVWALLSTYVYFDAFKHESLSTRANLTIADMFSREGVVDDAYFNGTFKLFERLIPKNEEPSLRVTSYYFDQGDPDVETDDQYVLIWSKERGDDYVPHTQPSLDNVSHKLPIMAHGDTSILVETHVPYTAPFTIGIGPFVPTDLEGIEFENFTPIRARFEGEVCFDNGGGNETCKPES
ncbi:TadE/TadG family type IV pilus assembly protein [Yoonia maritima]|uniref:TadE/TadG family type IV pilus assembly protein n=1 Tax=Yoonia maritima TaxID=1435347 RepID=UPI003735D5A7